MKKILESIPPLIAAALFGSAFTIYFYAAFDASLLILFSFPVLAVIGDLVFSKVEYQADASSTDLNLFSYVPRVGLSFFVLLKYALSVWAMHYPKDHGYQFPFEAYVRLLVLGCAVFYIAVGSTMGRAKPRIYWWNPNPSWINASSLAFKKTCRLLGRFCVAIGLITLLVDLFAPIAAAAFFFSVGLLGYFGIWLIYSYFIWKSDPEKQPIGMEP